MREAAPEFLLIAADAYLHVDLSAVKSCFRNQSFLTPLEEVHGDARPIQRKAKRDNFGDDQSERDFQISC